MFRNAYLTGAWGFLASGQLICVLIGEHLPYLVGCKLFNTKDDRMPMSTFYCRSGYIDVGWLFCFVVVLRW
ncbi:hypothetical protein V8C34DRAFT_288038 [Trichoderma compactum]